jgi:hypothetical protein
MKNLKINLMYRGVLAAGTLTTVVAVVEAGKKWTR